MTILYATLMFIFGATCFSFYYLIGLRIPKGESILGRSHCDQCNKTLRFVDIIPILGYLINKGKCHYCERKISICYLLYEILGGALFALSYLLYGFQFDLLVILITLSVFFILSVSDIHYKIVIDRVWMIGLFFLMIIRFIEKTFYEHLFSAFIMFIVLFIFEFAARKLFKKEALGGGDVKLYIFVGFVLTIYPSLLSLFLAALFGLIYGLIKRQKKDLEIPLVPFIALGVFIALLYGNDIIQLYLRLLGVSNA